MNYLDEIQCEEYYGEEPSWEDLVGPDDDTVLDDDDEDMLETRLDMPGILDDDLEDYVDLDADLFDANGGLTADAYAMLAEMDSAGAFI